MKHVLSSSLVCLLAVGDIAVAQQKTAPPSTVANTQDSISAKVAAPNTLTDGTAVKLRLAENLTSATAKPGQQVAFEVIDEVDVDGLAVIAKGAQALATVTTAESKKSMGRGGKLDVNVDSVRLMDGEKAALRAVKGGNGGGHVGAMTAGIVGTAIVFFPAAPLLLFIHGKDITIPKGTEVIAFVSGDMKLETAKFAQPGTSTVAGNGSVVAAQGLFIEANVPNCDIEVDGSFVGSTPSTLSVAPGKHEITVKKSGYETWTRNMTVGAGAGRLSADMMAVKAVGTK